MESQSAGWNVGLSTKDEMAREVPKGKSTDGGGGEEDLVGRNSLAEVFGAHGRYFDCISTVFNGVSSFYVVFSKAIFPVIAVIDVIQKG